MTSAEPVARPVSPPKIAMTASPRPADSAASDAHRMHRAIVRLPPAELYDRLTPAPGHGVAGRQPDVTVTKAITDIESDLAGAGCVEPDSGAHVDVKRRRQRAN